MHLSTQQSLSNYKPLQFSKQQPLHPLLLPPQTPPIQITQIKQKLHIQIQPFIHPPISIPYSPPSTLTNHITPPHSNRGASSQTCRCHYHLLQVHSDRELHLYY
ncbi:U32 family peptidase, partial [Staphylococcus epidermidis]|uniref:U32 family peptidase n=1 Tax=Staphylococcus epidermidis TaxID=1282 RepID=UPI0037DA017C